ncbi:MAG: FtsW/RodA/SpoVE family cell cycle protein [Anaerolineae bacterium]|nr:FtsW/RodA/SpoVE family cell cycle protein [Anaerolineae bacterium]
MTIRKKPGVAASPLTTWTARRERVFLLLAAVFLIIGALTLHLTYPPFTLRFMSLVILSFLISFSAAHVTLCRHVPRRDPLLLPVAALLSGWGLLIIGRLALNFLPRQVTWLLLSTLAMLAVVQIGPDLRWLRRFRYTWLLAGLALLAATLAFGVNPSGYGPRLWLRLGGVYFQPSEPLKLLMVVYMASYLAERRDLLLTARWRIGRLHLPSPAYLGPLAVMFGLTVLFLAWQQDLGAAMLFFFTFLAMFYLATGQLELVAAGLVLFAAAGVVGYVASTRLALRVDGWLNPWPNAADHAFQIVQSLIAIGAGGLSGQGLGLGRPTYIPAVHTDFVFSALAEEFGLLGALAAVALYGALLLRGLRAAARTPRPFERLLAGGLTAGLVIQAVIITAANVKLIPISGVTLPFLSYGGSSFLATFVALGLLLRISHLPHERERRPVASSDRTAMQPQLLRLACVLTLALALVASACGYWGVARAGWLTAREDNPRRVEYEQRLVRGRILDRNEAVLADVVIAPSGIVSRAYPLPDAAPAVGYASLRYGAGGIEAAFDAHLRGESGRSSWQAAWDNWLHRPAVGRDVQLTLDASLQQAAQAALDGLPGAIVLLDAESGALLVLASSPTFDPARLDATWDDLVDDPAAPLVNRATQGLYQPGAALETVVLAEVMERGTHAISDPAPDVTATVRLNGETVGCLEAPLSGDLVAAYAAACPGPFAALGEQLGEDGIVAAVERWGLTAAPPLELPTEFGEWAFGAAQLEAAGQGGLTVSPLQMALVAATLANDGIMPAPQLALRVETSEGGWRALDAPGSSRRVVSEETAGLLLLAWQPFGEGAVGHLGTAVAGENRAPHAWFLGVYPAGAPRYAVAVLLEHPADPYQAAQIGAALLQRTR